MRMTMDGEDVSDPQSESPQDEDSELSYDDERANCVFEPLHLDLENFESDDIPPECPYVLSSPRSLEACRLVGVRPIDLLPFRIEDARRQLEQSGDFSFEDLTLLREVEEERREVLDRCRQVRLQLIHRIDSYRRQTSGQTDATELQEEDEEEDDMFQADSKHSSEEFVEQTERQGANRTRKNNLFSVGKKDPLENDLQNGSDECQDDDDDDDMKSSNSDQPEVDQNLDEVKTTLRDTQKWLKEAENTSSEIHLLTPKGESGSEGNFESFDRKAERHVNSVSKAYLSDSPGGLWQMRSTHQNSLYRWNNGPILKEESVKGVKYQKARRTSRMYGDTTKITFLSQHIDHNEMSRSGCSRLTLGAKHIVETDHEQWWSQPKKEKPTIRRGLSSGPRDLHFTRRHNVSIVRILRAKKANEMLAEQFAHEDQLHRLEDLKRWELQKNILSSAWRAYVNRRRSEEAFMNDKRLQEAKKLFTQSQDRLRRLLEEKAQRSQQFIIDSRRRKAAEFADWKSEEETRRRAVENALEELLARDAEYRQQLSAHLEWKIQAAEERRKSIQKKMRQDLITSNSHHVERHKQRLSLIEKRQMEHIFSIKTAIQQKYEKATIAWCRGLVAHNSHQTWFQFRLQRAMRCEKARKMREELDSLLDAWRKQVLEVQTRSIRAAEDRAKLELIRRKNRIASFITFRQDRHHDQIKKVKDHLEKKQREVWRRITDKKCRLRPSPLEQKTDDHFVKTSELPAAAALDVDCGSYSKGENWLSMRQFEETYKKGATSPGP